MKRLPGFSSITAVLVALVPLVGAVCLIDASTGVALVQLATLIVLAVTLVVLRDYAADTRMLAKHAEMQSKIAVDQRDWTLRPCVVIHNLEARNEDSAFTELVKGSVAVSLSALYRIPSSFQVENCGIGPAFDIEVRKRVRGESRGRTQRVPHLAASAAATISFPLETERGEWWMEFRYMGASGAWFVSRYYVIDDLVQGFGTFLQRNDPDQSRIADWQKGELP